MTCIVGLETPTGVLLAADSLSSNNAEGFSLHTSKLIDFSVNSEGVSVEVGIGISGSWRMAQIILHHVVPQLAGSLTTINDPEVWIVTQFIPLLISELHNHNTLLLVDNVVSGDNILIALKGQVFEIQSDFSALRKTSGYAACGSGRYVAFGALHVLTKLLKEDKVEPLVVVTQALGAAMDQVPSVGGNIHTLFIAQPTSNTAVVAQSEEQLISNQ